ncbi:AAA family ATPase [Paracoccus angustae]|uniref:AAA family ATPase n=1 Tax=Paracoccus angustae TaxID=1671480 RepID=A0ABV7UAS5_9RHOB
MKQSGIIAFRAYGVVGFRDYEVNFDKSAKIIVGPNGTGKSTFLSLFYLFVTQQWVRLQSYGFERLEIEHEKGIITLNRETLDTYQGDRYSSPAARRIFEKLRAAGSTDLLKKPTLTRADRSYISEVAGIPLHQVSSFMRYVQGELTFSIGVQETEDQLNSLNLGIILYLPTYRRIEKDIHSIFPDIEDRIKEKLAKTGSSQRQGQNFIEISGFGMADIQSLIDSAVEEVRDFRRTSIESAYQEYIRDIVRGRIKKYSLSRLRSMSDKDLAEFQDRLNTDIFTDSDHKILNDKIQALRKKSSGQPSSENRFLGMFVEQLIEAHTRTKEKEKRLNYFIEVISNYLGPSKFAEFSDDAFKIKQVIENFSSKEKIHASSVSLDQLSSGEKQIVALFAYLLLSKKEGLLVLIDEPELSLSVPWQKKFLPDILAAESCAGVFAVTHSPFVFDNELRKSVVDVRRLAVQND